MIKGINTLKRVGRFTEIHNVRGTEHQFEKLNIVYAKNAAGKSTLCDVLRSMTTAEPAYVMGRKQFKATGEPEIVIRVDKDSDSELICFQNGKWSNVAASPKINVCDDRFVAENVLIGHHINVDQRRNLYGLVIGEQGVALRQAVTDAERELSAASDKARAAESALSALLPPGQAVDSFRNQAEITDVDQKIANTQKQLDSARQTKSKAEAIRQRPTLAPVPLSEISSNLLGVLGTSLDQASLVAEQEIREHLQTHAESLGVEWLGQGHDAKTGDGCPHCGQSMVGLDILAAYNAFFSGELQEQQQSRNALRSTTDQSFGEESRTRIREILVSHTTERTWWADAGGYEFTISGDIDLTEIENKHRAVHDAIIGALERKQANPATGVTLTSSEQRAIESWRSAIEQLSIYNDNIVEINNTLALKREEAGTVDLIPIQQSLASLESSKKRYEQEVVDGFAAYDAAVEARKHAQTSKQTANETERVHSNELLARYGDRINELLALFATDFRIVCGGANNNYVSFSGGPPSGQLAIELLGQKISSSPADAAKPDRPSLANTLSGGDRSALALAFFLAKIEQDQNLSESVVVFDDPFHSQDRSRQRRTIEQIHEISRKASQCFVFSHDLDFARAVAPIYGVSVRTFQLDPMEDRINLKCSELPMLPSRAYETKYSLLNDFILSPQNHKACLNEIAGTLRTVLEEYLQLKFPCRWRDGEDWLGTMIKKIRESDNNDSLFLCRRLVEGLTQVNEYSQRFHHRTTGATADVPDGAELVTYAQQTLSIIHQ